MKSLGDSGGPMIQFDDRGDAVLVGIVSTGIGCGNSSFPGVYLRTGAHADFLTDDMQQAENTSAEFLQRAKAAKTSRNVLVIVLPCVFAAIVLVAVSVLAYCFVTRRKSTGVDSTRLLS